MSRRCPEDDRVFFGRLRDIFGTGQRQRSGERACRMGFSGIKRKTRHSGFSATGFNDKR